MIDGRYPVGQITIAELEELTDEKAKNVIVSKNWIWLTLGRYTWRIRNWSVSVIKPVGSGGRF